LVLLHIAGGLNSEDFRYSKQETRNQMISLVYFRRPAISIARRAPAFNGLIIKSSMSNVPSDSDNTKQPGSWTGSVVSTLSSFVEKNTKAVAIVGGSVIALSITRGLYHMTHSFLTLTPYQAMYYGFVGGIICTGTVAIVLHYSERAYHINPDGAIRSAMQILYKNNDAIKVLGSRFYVQSVKTYASTQGGFGIRHHFPTWVSPEIQAAFVVQGSNGEEALATVVYNKKGMFGKEVLRFVGLEWIDSMSGKVMTSTITGDCEEFETRNDMKAHVTLLGKKYLR
jgi:hypothetical protein